MLRLTLGIVAVLAVLAAATLPATGFGRGLADFRGRMSVRSAQQRFLSLHALGRSMAIERGVPVVLVADPAAQTVSLREGCDGAGRLVRSRDFNLSYRVGLETGGRPLRICMTPTGYADPGQNSFDDSGRVTFLRGANAASVVLSPLGQAVMP